MRMGCVSHPGRGRGDRHERHRREPHRVEEGRVPATDLGREGIRFDPTVGRELRLQPAQAPALEEPVLLGFQVARRLVAAEESVPDEEPGQQAVLVPAQAVLDTVLDLRCRLRGESPGLAQEGGQVPPPATSAIRVAGSRSRTPSSETIRANTARVS